MLSEFNEDGVPVEADQTTTIEVDMTSISSVALARLIAEVRNDNPAAGRAYDRVHNRHNR